MTKEELKKEAQEQVNCCTPLYPECFIQGYLAGAEPRENKIADIKANCDLAIEGRDIKIKELEKMSKLKKQQLIEAKELLNEFMRIGKASDEDFEHDYSELIRETEQFIKGLEK